MSGLWLLLAADDWRSASFTVLVENWRLACHIAIHCWFVHVPWCACYPVICSDKLNINIRETSNLLGVWNSWCFLAVLMFLFFWREIVFLRFKPLFLLLILDQIWIFIVWALIQSIFLQQFSIWIFRPRWLCYFHIDWMVIKLGVPHNHVMLVAVFWWRVW